MGRWGHLETPGKDILQIMGLVGAEANWDGGYSVQWRKQQAGSDTHFFLKKNNPTQNDTRCGNNFTLGVPEAVPSKLFWLPVWHCRNQTISSHFLEKVPSCANFSLPFIAILSEELFISWHTKHPSRKLCRISVGQQVHIHCFHGSSSVVYTRGEILRKGKVIFSFIFFFVDF